MKLHPEEVRYFRHNGFLRLPTVLSSDRVSSLRETILKDIENVVEPAVRNAEGRVVRLSKIWDRAAIFRDTITCEEVLEPMESLIGPNIEFIRNRHNHATLNLSNKSTYLHRDIMQWTRNIVTVIFYLEETTVENGCTLVLPGSQTLPTSTKASFEQNEWLQETRLREQLLPIPMPEGGMLVIDSMIIHTGGLNRSGATRMSMTAGYHSVDELMDAGNPKRVLVRGDHIYDGNDR
ncbi:MAG: phytanoyl-CoA dioxygenase family protein [Planctomycetota bacterium]|nr:phytanoyl-CoA dioxygenase family protein [Planctomycetota bacterium]MDA1140579.1 phytanoyl-CoA dioxygenase family protein [Planctomycetota bacterium]